MVRAGCSGTYGTPPHQLNILLWKARGSDDVPSGVKGFFYPRFQIEMFIRWKRRKKAATKPWRKPRRRSDAGDSLYCVLVECQRVDGSPRQKVISYLGSLDEGDREKLWLRVDFWDLVSAKLDNLELTPRERTRIEKAIDLVVLRVPQEEVAAFKKERNEYWEITARLFRIAELMRALERTRF